MNKRVSTRSPMNKHLFDRSCTTYQLPEKHIFLGFLLKIISETYLNQYPLHSRLPPMFQWTHSRRSHWNNSWDQRWAHYHSGRVRYSRRWAWSKDSDDHCPGLAPQECNVVPVIKTNVNVNDNSLLLLVMGACKAGNKENDDHDDDNNDQDDGHLVRLIFWWAIKNFWRTLCIYDETA